MESKYGPVIKKVYTKFNARDINSIFSVMNTDIHWPKAFEGGYITGYEAVRAYWTKQWSEINPKVEPVAIAERPDGKVEVLVDQLVKDLEGKILFHGQVKHIYTFTDDLISSMNIEAL
jgi:hypothetical protein